MAKLDLEWEDQSEPTGKLDLQWEDSPRKKKVAEPLPDQPEPPSLKRFGHDTIGAVNAVQDMVGSFPGLVGAGTAALTDAIRGGTTSKQPLRDTIEQVMQSAGEGNLADYLAPKASLEAARKSAGYQGTNKVLQSPFQGLGNIAGAAGSATGDPEFAGELGKSIDVGSQAAALLAGGGHGTPKPGTAAFYRNLHEQILKGDPALDRASGAAQSSYTQARKDQAGQDIKDQQDRLQTRNEQLLQDPQRLGLDLAWEDEQQGVDQAHQQPQALRQDAGNLPDQNLRSPYAIDPQERAGLEQELNPPTEHRPGGQGELFTQEMALTKDQLDAQRYPMEDRQPSARDASAQREINLETPDSVARRDINDLQTPPEMRGLDPHDKPIEWDQEVKDKVDELKTQADPKKAAATMQRPPVDIPYEVKVAAERKVATGPRNRFAEYIPISLARELASHDRLTDPKSPTQFLKMEKEVMQNGVTEALEFTYSTADKKLVQTNGHTRTASALKHGITEIPGYVQITDKPFRGQEKKTAVTPPSIPELGQRKLAKFSEFGFSQARPPAGQRLPYVPKKQRGVIHPDILTFGASRLWEEAQKRFPNRIQAFEKFMGKWKGTFWDDELKTITNDVIDPKSQRTVVLMSPDEFHKAAMMRSAEFVLGKNSGDRRMSIRSGLRTEEGLKQMPKLWLRQEGPNTFVIGHEGRHRMDVFREQRIDKIPVMITHETKRWGEWENRPSVIGNEEFTRVIPLPESLPFPDKGLDFTSPDSTKGPKSQLGMANTGFSEAVVDIFKKMAGKGKGAANATIQVAKQFSMDRRSLEQVVKEDIKDPKQLEDVSDNFLTAAHGLVDKAVSILSEKRSGTGQILKNIRDRRSLIDRKAELDTEAALKGEKYLSQKDILGRSFEQREWSDEGALTQLLKTPKGEVDEMFRIWNEAVGKDGTPNFKTENQRKIFEAIQKQFDKVLDKVNQARASVDLAPIKKINNYLPTFRLGDYRLAVKDGMGNVKAYFGFDNIWEAKIYAKKFRKEFPQMVVDDPYHLDTSKYRFGDLSMWEEAMRVMSSDDKATQSLQQAYNRIVGKRGFGTRSIMRKGIFGGIKPEDAIKMYFEKANRYVANIEKTKLKQELGDLPLEVQNKIPNALKYAHDYIDSATGKQLTDKLEFITDLGAWLSKKAGFGESGFRRLSQGTNPFMMASWLFTPKFMVAQMFQHTNAISAMIKQGQLQGEGLGIKSAAYSYFKGLSGVLSPDQTLVEGMNWTKRNGYLDPAVVEMFSKETASRDGWIKGLSSYTLGKLEEQFVRMPVFAMFENQLRKTVPDKQARFEQASQMMAYYMVEYNRAGSPMVYNKMGLLGDMARPMKTYSHNAFGQFAEYLSYADFKDTKTLAPLATFMGTQALVGGLKGVMLVAEAAAIITLINTVFNQNIPTPDEWMITSGMSDAAVYGLASTVTGQDMSQTVGAPQMPQMFSLPVADYIGAPLLASAKWLVHSIQGVDTEADKMAAMLGVSPAAMRPVVEGMFMGPDGMVPKPAMNMKGNYRRSENEQLWDITFGGISVSEARANALSRFIKQDLAYVANQRMSAITAIADRVTNGKQIEPELLQQYIQQGGSMSNLRNDLKRAIQEHAQTYIETQQMPKSITPGAAKQLEVIKNNLDGNSGSGGGGGSFIEKKDLPKSALTQAEKDQIIQLNKDGQKGSVNDQAVYMRAREANFKEKTMQAHVDNLTNELKRKNLSPMAMALMKRELGQWQDALRQYSDVPARIEVRKMSDAGYKRSFVKEIPSKSIYPSIDASQIREDMYYKSNGGNGTNMDYFYRNFINRRVPNAEGRTPPTKGIT